MDFIHHIGIKWKECDERIISYRISSQQKRMLMVGMAVTLMHLDVNLS
jgi:hypothetical protein